MTVVVWLLSVGMAFIAGWAYGVHRALEKYRAWREEDRAIADREPLRIVR